MDAAPANTRVLIIDDQEDVRTVLSLMLEAHGFETLTAGSGEEGLAHAARTRVDVVFTDLRMPGISGWEVARRLRSLDPPPRVVLVTGWVMDNSPELLRARGIDAVLLKPFTFEEVGAAATGRALSEERCVS